MPYLSISGQLGESWTFKSWGMKTYVLNPGLSIVQVYLNMALVMLDCFADFLSSVDLIISTTTSCIRFALLNACDKDLTGSGI